MDRSTYLGTEPSGLSGYSGAYLGRDFVVILFDNYPLQDLRKGASYTDTFVYSEVYVIRNLS